ncbi:bifunctional folylpolyglutamate synthase/dihydrofolate synthase [Mesoplasma seiffertii]|uniref:bifunctional folylpolyglutamate synthase/dihydrofolate synthase n=1 Tax=Mesoplasma seiffertii TaxID=28224 RepID=UPI00047E9424|nr:Mur ligase family protein [Mesoplasma seiffertii]
MISVDKDFIPIKPRFANEYNLIKVLAKLGNPQKRLPTINVVGTNGKGSTSYYLSKGLLTKYQKVGLFIGPAFLWQNERIQINNEYISDQNLEKYLNQISADIEEYSLTFFEIWTLIAILYFADQNVDIVVMEAGIGGKNDCTNLMTNQILTVLTSVSFDHMELLGTSIEAILEQKINIAKPGTKLVVSDDNKKYQSVIEKIIADKNVEIIYADLLPDKVLYQQGNKGLAQKTLEIIGITKCNISELNPPLGRFTKIVRKNQTIILDGAHNVDGINQLIKTVKAEKEPYIVLYASIASKDYQANLSQLTSNFENVYLTSFDHFKAWNLSEIDYPNKIISWKEFLETHQDDNILVCGSLYFIPQVYEYLNK